MNNCINELKAAIKAQNGQAVDEWWDKHKALHEADKEIQHIGLHASNCDWKLAEFWLKKYINRK